MFYVGALFCENGSFRAKNVKFENKQSAIDFIKNNIKSTSTWLTYYMYEKGEKSESAVSRK